MDEEGIVVYQTDRAQIGGCFEALRGRLQFPAAYREQLVSEPGPALETGRNVPAKADADVHDVLGEVDRLGNGHDAQTHLGQTAIKPV